MSLLIIDPQTVGKLTSPHWQKCLAAFHCSFWFLLLPTMGERPLDRPRLVMLTWWPFIHSGQLPRLQRWTKRAHSRKSEARATTGASYKNRKNLTFRNRFTSVRNSRSRSLKNKTKQNKKMRKAPGPERQPGWRRPGWSPARSS